MFAVIRTGGKQYRVAEDDVIVVEKLAGEPGSAIEFDQVLMLDDGDGLSVGAPLVDGARVAATVLDQARADKIIVFKKKRRKNYRRTQGHRQDITVLRITGILAKGKKAEPEADQAVEAETPDTAETAAPETAAPEAPAAETEAKPKRRRRAAKKDDAETEAAPVENDEAGDTGDSEEKS